MHHREKKLPTNTGRLASLALPNCEIRLRGLHDSPLDTSGIVEDSRHALLLYPSTTATVLSHEFIKTITKPITLIVPDGSWRQAAKVAKRESFLKDVPHVTLPKDKNTQYMLRQETKDGGLATYEAIARSLGFIESPKVQEELEKLFQEMVKRTLKSRGTLESLNALKNLC